MNHKIELYGLSSEERHRLQKRWHNMRAAEQESFGDFEGFAKWSAENHFAIGKILVAKDIRYDRSPGNAYWTHQDDPETDAEKTARVKLTAHPCETCPRNYYCDKACYLRKKWWDMGMEKLRKRWGIK